MLTAYVFMLNFIGNGMSLRARWMIFLLVFLPIVGFVTVGFLYDDTYTVHTFATDRPEAVVRDVLSQSDAPMPYGFHQDSVSVAGNGAVIQYITGGAAQGMAVYILEGTMDSTEVYVSTRLAADNFLARSIMAVEIWMDPPDFSPVEEALSAAAPVLLGFWSADSTDQVLWVQPDGRLSWAIDGIWLHGLEWSVDEAAAPSRFSIAGFTSGPLAGLTLYGVFELEGDRRMRFDAEPGEPGANAWPSEFSASTVTYRRTTLPRTEPVLRQQDP